MSTPDQPETPQLTRKQLRELRNTGVTPIITEAMMAPPETPAAVVEEATPVPAPLARAAEPVVVPPAPEPDASVDLGVAPLTRRQARQQERIRTASVPVITADLIATYAAERTAAEDATPVAAVAAVEDRTEPTQSESEEDADLRIFESEGGVVVDDAEAERATVHDGLGADLLAGTAPAVAVASFDQLLTRDTATTGSVASPSALIVSQAPSDGPLVAPVSATGEIILTGSLALPEGMGSTGHAPGTTDGKDIDAALVDGELPTHSSPTPIAASAAVSTVVTDDEIIRPPAPEKGNKLMLSLAITAGVLALALVGVLVFALAAGVFVK
jgi:hypothetical protein